MKNSKPYRAIKDNSPKWVSDGIHQFRKEARNTALSETLGPAIDDQLHPEFIRWDQARKIPELLSHTAKDFSHAVIDDTVAYSFEGRED